MKPVQPAATQRAIILSYAHPPGCASGHSSTYGFATVHTGNAIATIELLMNSERNSIGPVHRRNEKGICINTTGRVIAEYDCQPFFFFRLFSFLLLLSSAKEGGGGRDESAGEGGKKKKKKQENKQKKKYRMRGIDRLAVSLRLCTEDERDQR